MNEIDMNDLPLVSKTGWWMIRDTQQKKHKAPIEMFRARFKAAYMNLEAVKKQFAADSKIVKNAQRKYNFYHSQINEDESDIFTLLMYNTDEWKV